MTRLRRAPGDYRWVDPRDMHLTFRFIGEVSDERLPEIHALMDEAAIATDPFEIVYGGLGAFDSLDAPRVVWLGVDEGAAPLEAVAARLKRDEQRPYTPHLTLGRNRREECPPELPGILRAEPRLGLRVVVDRLSLYASRPAPFGHAYEILRQAPFRGAVEPS